MKKALLTILALYLLLSGFSVSFFYGNGWPEVNNHIQYLWVIPHLGAGALFWSLFFGIGIVILLVSSLLTWFWFRSGNFLYLFFQPLLGVVGGFVFRCVST